MEENASSGESEVTASTEESNGAAASEANVEAGEQVKAGPTNGKAAEDGANRGEVSVSTLGRMMGLATVSELKLVEGKIDLMATRVNNLTVRMERALGLLSNAPTGNDLERIDVQIGSLKTLIREVLSEHITEKEEGSKKGISEAKIKTNKASEAKAVETKAVETEAEEKEEQEEKEEDDASPVEEPAE